MIYVNDDHYDQAYFERHNAAFSQHDVLGQCQGKRIAVCSSDPAYWLAVCLYLKSCGASAYPIYGQTPKLAAKRLAKKANCHYLLLEEGRQCLSLGRTDNDRQAVLVQTSSGTTGEPKVIMRTWHAIDEELASYVANFTLPNTMTPLIACPITHSYGLIAGVLVALQRGLEPIVISNINPKYLIKKLLQMEKPLLYSSPTLLQSVVKLYPADKKIHAVMTSGTALPQAWLNALAARTDHLFQQYGCSEAGCVAINSDTQSAEHIGFPLPHLTVSAGNHRDAPKEIVVNYGEKTIYTRDLGYFDDVGGLHFIARLDDTINVAGLNVYPQDVEDVVLEMTEITDAVVFKRQDPLSGERVCLQYVATEKMEPSRIRRWCGTRLASFQLPVEFEQVAQIEKMANGKVSRKALAERAVAIPALG